TVYVVVTSHVSIYIEEDTGSTNLPSLSLHDALPIWRGPAGYRNGECHKKVENGVGQPSLNSVDHCTCDQPPSLAADRSRSILYRSEEHTSELQSRENLVCRLLLEKKKTIKRMLYQQH